MRNFVKLIGRITFAIALVALVVWSIFPLYWTFIGSTVSSGGRFEDPPRMVPDFSQWGVLRVFEESQILTWLGNSGLIAAGIIVLTLPMAVMAAYALSRYRFRGRGPFSMILFITQMLPETLLVVPLYTAFITVGLINDLRGVVFVSTAFIMPVCTWLLKGAIDSVPVEIEEAARVDGVPRFGIVWTIVVPLVRPTVVATAIMSFFYGWDEYLFSVTFLSSEDKWPASVGLASYMGDIRTPVQTIMSISLVYALPAILFFWLVQRSIVKGLTSGAVKG